ncbi:MAG: hypothetical protein OEV44_07590 [Spirochaetota bacterium]|nr:hypothetical protein [Spirochaetota bacterium]
MGTTISTGNFYIKQIIVLLICLILEVIVRYFRLPIFPIWFPIFLWKDEIISFNIKIIVLYSIIAGLIIFLYLNTLDFTITFFCLLMISFFQIKNKLIRKIIKGWILPIIVTFTWLVLSIVFGNYPTGSFSFEIFFTAVFVRLTGSEYIAGTLSRFVIILLTYLIYLPIKHIIKKLNLKLNLHLMQLSLILIITINLISCNDNKKIKSFEPERLKPTEKEIFLFQPNKKLNIHPKHPILTNKNLSNNVCLACHKDKVEETNLPVNEKRMHEIHFAIKKLNLKCIFCHEHAGKQGFPDLISGGNQREEYNKKCIDCHNKKSQKDVLNWNRRYR